MSSRSRSDFGSLGSRLGGDEVVVGSRAVHVVIDGHQLGLLARWRRDLDGSWLGLVAVVDGPDDFVASWVPAERLRPVEGD